MIHVQPRGRLHHAGGVAAQLLLGDDDERVGRPIERHAVLLAVGGGVGERRIAVQREGGTPRRSRTETTRCSTSRLVGHDVTRRNVAPSTGQASRPGPPAGRLRTRSPPDPPRPPDRRRPRCATASLASDTRARRRWAPRVIPGESHSTARRRRARSSGREAAGRPSSPAVAAPAALGRRPFPPCAAGVARLHDLHHDAERLLGVQERFRHPGSESSKPTIR